MQSLLCLNIKIHIKFVINCLLFKTFFRPRSWHLLLIEQVVQYLETLPFIVLVVEYFVEYFALQTVCGLVFLICTTKRFSITKVKITSVSFSNIIGVPLLRLRMHYLIKFIRQWAPRSKVGSVGFTFKMKMGIALDWFPPWVRL